MSTTSGSDSDSLQKRNENHFAALKQQRAEDQAALKRAEDARVAAMEPEEREAYLKEKKDKEAHEKLKSKMLKHMAGSSQAKSKKKAVLGSRRGKKGRKKTKGRFGTIEKKEKIETPPPLEKAASSGSTRYKSKTTGQWVEPEDFTIPPPPPPEPSMLPSADELKMPPPTSSSPPLTPSPKGPAPPLPKPRTITTPKPASRPQSQHSIADASYHSDDDDSDEIIPVHMITPSSSGVHVRTSTLQSGNMGRRVSVGATSSAAPDSISSASSAASSHHRTTQSQASSKSPALKSITTSWTKRTVSGSEMRYEKTVTKPLQLDYDDLDGNERKRKRDQGCAGVCYNTMKIFLAVAWVFALLFAFICLMMTMFAGWGATSTFRGVGGWHLIAFLSFLCIGTFGMAGLVLFVTRCGWKEERRKLCCRMAKYYALVWAVSFLMFFVITELLLVLLIPSESFFAIGAIASEDASMFNTSQCDWFDNVAAAEKFYADQNAPLASKGIKYVVGGVPRNIGTTKAMVVDNSVYFSKRVKRYGLNGKVTTLPHCPSPSLLVHELFHVQDFQTGYFFSKGAPYFWSWLMGQIKSRNEIYNYGNLTAHRVANMAPGDFNLEQRAMIVQDWYDALVKNSTSAGDENPDLEFYASALLRPDTKRRARRRLRRVRSPAVAREREDVYV